MRAFRCYTCHMYLGLVTVTRENMSIVSVLVLFPTSHRSVSIVLVFICCSLAQGEYTSSQHCLLSTARQEPVNCVEIYLVSPAHEITFYTVMSMRSCPLPYRSMPIHMLSFACCPLPIVSSLLVVLNHIRRFAHTQFTHRMELIKMATDHQHQQVPQTTSVTTSSCDSTRNGQQPAHPAALAPAFVP